MNVPTVGDQITGCFQIGHYGPHAATPGCLITDERGRCVIPAPVHRDLDVPADVDDEPCPSCGARRADCIRVAGFSCGRVCCVHCAESPIGDTHRGPRE